MEMITNIYNTEYGTIVQRIMPMPKGTKACVIMGADNEYNVYIDPSSNIQKEFEHELNHIRNDHLNSNKTIKEVEDYL